MNFATPAIDQLELRIGDFLSADNLGTRDVKHSTGDFTGTVNDLPTHGVVTCFEQATFDAGVLFSFDKDVWIGGHPVFNHPGLLADLTSRPLTGSVHFTHGTVNDVATPSPDGMKPLAELPFTRFAVLVTKAASCKRFGCIPTTTNRRARSREQTREQTRSFATTELTTQPGSTVFACFVQFAQTSPRQIPSARCGVAKQLEPLAKERSRSDTTFLLFLFAIRPFGHFLCFAT